VAARARIRFSTSGAGKVTGAFNKVGGAAGSAGGRVGKFGTSAGGAFYKIMRNVGRITMFSAGVQKMGKSASESKRDIKGFADGSVTALSGLSKKFSELRRQYYFFKFAGQKLAAPVTWAMGEKKPKGKSEKVRRTKDGDLFRSIHTQEERNARRKAAIERRLIVETARLKADLEKKAFREAVKARTKLLSRKYNLPKKEKIIYRKFDPSSMAEAIEHKRRALLSKKFEADSAERKRRALLSKKFLRPDIPRAKVPKPDIPGVKAPKQDIKGVEKATSVWGRFLNMLSGGGRALSSVAKKIFNLKNALTVLVAAFVAVSVAGGAAFVYIGYKTAQFAKRMVVDFMSIREAFRSYEISLGGIIKNTYALGKMMKFATKYAAEYPAMFEEVLDTFRSLAALPALKPMFRRADEKDLKNIMNIIQGFATLDPIQGVKGAGIALREALSGDMRSIRRRFEISAHAIAEAGGYTLNEITKDSQKALKAFGEFVKLNVPAKSMADAAMNIGIQIGNLRDQYRSFVNDMMKSTGAYWEVVTAISSLNDWLTKVFASPIVKEWAMDAGKHMRAFVATLKTILSEVDWTKYLKEGDLLGGVVEAAKRISIVLRTIIEEWKSPFLTFVSKIAKVLMEGLPPIIKDVVKTLGALFYEGMVAAGKASGKAFMGGLLSTLVKGVLPRGLPEAMSEGWGKRRKAKKEAKGDKGITDKFKDLGARAKGIFDYELGRDKKEIVTPELSLKEHKYHLESLKQQLLAYKMIGTSKKDLKGITNSLAEAEKNLTRARALEEWRKTGGKEQEEAQKQMEGYDKAILKAAKSGKKVDLGIYIKKFDLQEKLDALAEMYDKTVDQKNAWTDLVSMVKAAPDSLKDWLDKYKMAKKDAGALLLVVKKLQEVAEGKVPDIKREDYIELLKKRIELTEEATKKEKKYKKELAKIPRNIAKNLANLAGGIQSTILSFASKLQGAFIGIAKYGGEEAAPPPDLTGIPTKRKTKQDRYEELRQKSIKARSEGREWDFRRMVMEKIGDVSMVPKGMFGMGRAGMTYREGLGAGEGKKVPPYISYILQGIQKAVVERKGAGEFPGGRKALAEMRMALLEKAVPFTKHRSEERAGLYAKMAGAQTDLMKATMETVRADIKMQQDQLKELRNNVANTKMALSKSDTVARWLENIASGIRGSLSSNRIPQTSTIPSAQIGNSKITQSNPKTVTFEQGGYIWEAMAAG